MVAYAVDTFQQNQILHCSPSKLRVTINLLKCILMHWFCQNVFGPCELIKNMLSNSLIMKISKKQKLKFSQKLETLKVVKLEMFCNVAHWLLLMLQKPDMFLFHCTIVYILLSENSFW